MIILFLSLVTLILLTEFLFNYLIFLKIHPSAYITQTQYAGINQIENYNYMDVSFNFAVCNYLPPFTVRTTYQAINNYRNIDLI